jgi:hypothetical protein
MLTTVMPPLVPPMPTTVTAIHIEEQDYSDEQFYADVRKAGKRLDAMAEQARREYARRLL